MAQSIYRYSTVTNTGTFSNPSYAQQSDNNRAVRDIPANTTGTADEGNRLNGTELTYLSGSGPMLDTAVISSVELGCEVQRESSTYQDDVRACLRPVWGGTTASGDWWEGDVMADADTDYTMWVNIINYNQAPVWSKSSVEAVDMRAWGENFRTKYNKEIRYDCLYLRVTWDAPVTITPLEIDVNIELLQPTVSITREETCFPNSVGIKAEIPAAQISTGVTIKPVCFETSVSCPEHYISAHQTVIVSPEQIECSMVLYKPAVNADQTAVVQANTIELSCGALQAYALIGGEILVAPFEIEAEAVFLPPLITAEELVVSEFLELKSYIHKDYSVYSAITFSWEMRSIIDVTECELISEISKSLELDSKIGKEVEFESSLNVGAKKFID